jgi:hypothetical protein
MFDKSLVHALFEQAPTRYIYNSIFKCHGKLVSESVLRVYQSIAHYVARTLTYARLAPTSS